MTTTAGSLALAGVDPAAGRLHRRAAARGRRGHPRQDQPLASGPTSARRARPAAGAAAAASAATPTRSTAIPRARARAPARRSRRTSAPSPSAPRPTARSSRPSYACGLVGIKPTRRPGQPLRHHPDLAQPGHRRARWRAPSPTPRSCSAPWPASTSATRPPARAAARRAADYTRFLDPDGLQGRAHRRRPPAARFGRQPADRRLLAEARRGDEGSRAPRSSIRPRSPSPASSATASSRCCSTSSRRTSTATSPGSGPARPSTRSRR